MLYKFLKFLSLSSLTLIWGGCSDDSETLYGTPQVACELDHMWSDECGTTSNIVCTDTYYCKDKVVCFKQYEGKNATFDCRDKLGNKTTYTEDEFNSLYYVESERIH